GLSLKHQGFLLLVFFLLNVEQLFLKRQAYLHDFQLQNAIVEVLRKASDRKTWREEKTIIATKVEKYTDTL
ncbi:MAG: hypothetical protein IJ269_02315, partial [Bacteroidales bacterium]|nr:hypothetical protein [Bacteroidales bacterium]